MNALGRATAYAVEFEVALHVVDGSATGRSVTFRLPGRDCVVIEAGTAESELCGELVGRAVDRIVAARRTTK